MSDIMLRTQPLSDTLLKTILCVKAVVHECRRDSLVRTHPMDAQTFACVAPC